MANHAFLNSHIRKHGILFDAFCDGIDISRFGEYARIVRKPDSISIELLSKPKPEPDEWPLTTACFWKNRAKVEWRHQPGELSWWFSEMLAAKAARYASNTLNTQVFITDEGLGANDHIEPVFDEKYPTLNSWILGSMCPGPPTLIRKILRQFFRKRIKLNYQRKTPRGIS